jgi:hypothetical protein
MQKLILRYDWCVPYEASGTEVIPFEYESLERAYVDFCDLQEKAGYFFWFLGHEFNKSDKDVKFFTLEEWFERYKFKQQ